MRDYKNVKVPRSYRSRAGRRSVKRLRTGGRAARPDANGKSGIAGLVRKIAAAVLIVGAAFLAWQGYRAATRADMFVVAGVDVKGAGHLGTKDLRELAAMFQGQNIFRADLDAAVRRARANPWVKEARIYRSLPNRITLAFTERTPSVILETGGDRFLADDEGMIIERLAKDNASSWPLPVVAIRRLQARPGEPVDSEGLAEAMQLLAEISARGGWRPADVTVRADSPETLTVVYAEREFKIGSGRYGEKLHRLAEVMADVQARGLEIASMDLRPERQTAVMPKKIQSSEFGVRSSGKKENKGRR